MKHNVTPGYLMQLRAISLQLSKEGNDSASRLVADAAYSLNCAVHEFQCITELAEHPKRHARKIRKWIKQIQELGWTQEF